MINTTRRSFLKGAGALAFSGILPVSLVTVEQANAADNFTFAWITDAHIQQIKGTKFVDNWDNGLKRAVAELSNINPKPDFIYFGGDMAQQGLASELDHGMAMLTKPGIPVRAIVGEHDYYFDMGVAARKTYDIPSDNYSFDHKGVHFVALNTILASDEWLAAEAKDPRERMIKMERLDNPKGSPFRLGKEGLAWLKSDLDKVDKNTSVIVFSHSPIQKIFAGWNFWTEDAEEIQALLQPFKRSTVMYNHVHQPQANQIGNIAFISNFSTAWPWPYPSTYTQEPNALPTLILPMNRADIANQRDATGWVFVDTNGGEKFDVTFNGFDNPVRKVSWNGKFADVGEAQPGPAQMHY
ncbi:MAG: metallophosphoesterase [Gammaproteobacteria bacterium]